MKCSNPLQDARKSREDRRGPVKLSLRRVAGIAIAIVLAGCDSPTPVEPAERLRVLPESPNLFVGSVVRLVPFNLSGAPLDSGIKWSSSDPGVVSVDGGGRITGVARGTARIRAIRGEEFAETVATVVGPEASVRAGGSTACGIAASTGELYCWGLNSRGEAAVGDTVTVVREPREVSSDLTFSSVSLSSWHGCGTTTAGLHCWGMNHRGQLGLGAAGPVQRAPAPVSGGGSFVAVSVASTAIDDPVGIICTEFGCSSRSCAITSDGTLHCWGNGVVAPAPLGIVNRFRSIEVGLQYTCGIDFANIPYCWGFGRHSEATKPLIAGTEAPPIPGNYRFQSLSGTSHVCGLDFDGDVYCWGSNTAGQLGAPSGTEYCMPYLGVRDPCRAAPAKVETSYKFLSVSAGGALTCGIATTLEVICWGSNRNGELGNGTTVSMTQIPTPVASALRFRSVSAGLGFACAVALDGDAYCWGSNTVGQLGNGSTASSPLPVRVSGSVRFR